MHDSRGAEIKVGDRVLIEAEVTELQQADENYCCCTVKVITPEQPTKSNVMAGPVFSAMSTKMLTKVGAAIAFALLLMLPGIAEAQCSGNAGGCSGGGLIRRAKARVSMPALPTIVMRTQTVQITTIMQSSSAQAVGCSASAAGCAGVRQGILLLRRRR